MLTVIMIFITIFTLIHSAVIMTPQQLKYEYFQYATFKASLSWEQIMRVSLDMAVQSCQAEFKWQRWNCPSTDFFLRRNIMPQLLDREDVYVSAIATTAILYTLTKDCANGKIAECGCTSDISSAQCAEDPSQALQLYEAEFGASPTWQKDFISETHRHNHRVISKLLEKSLVRQCICKSMDNKGRCKKEHCIKALKSFDEMSKDLRQMYEKAVQLGSTGKNLKIIWANIPLDTLVFMKDSPNHCEPDALAHWPGTRGRQCSRQIAGEPLTVEERKSCIQLCRSCGYRVRSEMVRHERACNCKLAWGFRLQCETCVQTEREYFCY